MGRKGGKKSWGRKRGGCFEQGGCGLSTLIRLPPDRGGSDHPRLLGYYLFYSIGLSVYAVYCVNSDTHCDHYTVRIFPHILSTALYDECSSVLYHTV